MQTRIRPTRPETAPPQPTFLPPHLPRKTLDDDDIYHEAAQLPTFVRFPCEWHGCRAVLSNLDRLKRHIGIAHGHEARRTLRCRWDACGQLPDEDDDMNPVATPASFATIGELDEHVGTLHVRSVMWRLGDGPRGDKGGYLGDLGVVPGQDSSAGEPPRYLFWAGEQVTPWIKDQRIETPAERRQRKRRLDEFRDNLNAE